MTQAPTAAEVAGALSPEARAAVRTAHLTVSGGMRVHWRHTCWAELRRARLLKPHEDSSYLNEVGLAVRAILMEQDRHD